METQRSEKEEQRLRKQLKPKRFKSGEWAIMSDEAIEYIYTRYAGARKNLQNTAKQVVEVRERELFDIIFLIEGKRRATSSLYYRKATEEEIKEAEVKELFE